MGTRAGYCLQNVRLAFDAPSKYVDAKAAMLANKNAGTLHSIDTLPKNVAVPVFVDTSSPYEHVEVADRGTFYSDGKKVSNPMRQKFFGWGETLNGTRIVKWVDDPKPAKKSNEEIANEVIQGKWGNGQERKDRLAAAGYDWGAIQAIVDQKVKGGSAAIKIGDTVIVNGAGTASSNGTGAVTRVYSNQRMRVIMIANGRYGCNQYNQDGGVTGWWAASQVRKA
jgi:hypothetical protein